MGALAGAPCSNGVTLLYGPGAPPVNRSCRPRSAPLPHGAVAVGVIAVVTAGLLFKSGQSRALWYPDATSGTRPRSPRSSPPAETRRALAALFSLLTVAIPGRRGELALLIAVSPAASMTRANLDRVLPGQRQTLLD